LVQQTVVKSTIGDPTWVQTASLLTEADSPMYTTSLETTADLAVALLTHYSFDLSGYTASELVGHWKKIYPNHWLHLAVIEALYQGRYKAVSAQQILTMWQRRGHTTYHFNMEFERLICSKFPESLTAMPKPALPPASLQTQQQTQQQEVKNYKSPLPVHNASSKVLTTDQSRRSNAREYNNTTTAGEKNSETPFAETENFKQKQTSVALVKRTEEDEKDNLYFSASQSQPIPPSSALTLERLQTLESFPSSEPLSDKTTKPLSVYVNHPPIGQFSPDKSERSETFTSKLKVLVDG
jgi:hypothetical protein